VLTAAVAGWAGAARAVDAGAIQVELWGGWGGAAMGRFNDDARASFEASRASWEAGGGTVERAAMTGLAGGGRIGVEAGAWISPAWRATLRAGYAFAGTATFDFRGTAFTDLGVFGTLRQTTDEHDTVSLSLVPVLVGGRFVQTVQQVVRVTLGLWGGWGFGRMTRFLDDTTTTAGTGLMAASSGTTRLSGRIPLSGSGPAAEALFGVAWLPTDEVEVGVEGGYHAAAVARMTTTREVDLTGDGKADTKAGVVETGADGKPLRFDYSGVTVTARLSVAF
jgi:hypothetical protein